MKSQNITSKNKLTQSTTPTTTNNTSNTAPPQIYYSLTINHILHDSTNITTTTNYNYLNQISSAINDTLKSNPHKILSASPQHITLNLTSNPLYKTLIITHKSYTSKLS